MTRIRAFAPDRPTNPDKAFPFFLPDGEHFLFTHPVGEVATLQVGTIRSQETRSLVPADSRAVFVPPGFVLYVRNGALLAQPFDPRALAMTGDAMTVIDDVAHFTPTGEAAFSASQDGTLVVRRRKGRTQLRWFNREGRATSTLLAPDYYGFLSISRNGQQLAVDVEDPRRSTQDLWVVDLGRSVPTRLTSSPRSEWMGRWAPDGSHLAFSADWEGPPNLYVTEMGGQPQVLVPFDRTAHFSSEWTPSGTHVVYARRDERFGHDLWMVEVSTGERQPILATEFNEDRPAVSPNGQWLAYVSDASGRNEIYLRSFPKGTWQARLSVDGGHDPVWRQDGRELFYYEPSGAIMSVQIDGSGSGRPQASLPARLFPIDERAFVSFDVTADGQRFLLNLAEPGALSRPDEVIVNWLRMIKR